MRLRATLLFLLLASMACHRSSMLPASPSPITATPSPLVPPLAVPTDRWVGLTSFRLVELQAHGHAAQVRSTLTWAQAHGVTIVRVLATAKNLFTLTATDGQRALPAVIRAARSAGVDVEVVALADTHDWTDAELTAQVRAIGSIVRGTSNVRVEIANEPYHPTQASTLTDPSTLRRLAALVPAGIPVAWGAPEDDTNPIYDGGTYITVHSVRWADWAGVEHLLDVAHWWARQSKDVIDDEPIGAASTTQAGRRDANANRWRARGALTAVLGLGQTFHCDTCLQGRPPAGQELTDFAAWREGMNAVPSRPGMTVRPAGTGPLASDANPHCVTRADAQWGVVVCVDDAAHDDPSLSADWQVIERHTWTGLRVLTVYHPEAQP